MENLNEILKNAIANALINTHTATIGRVVKVNSTTIDVQPVINHVHTPPACAGWYGWNTR